MLNFILQSKVVIEFLLSGRGRISVGYRKRQASRRHAEVLSALFVPAVKLTFMLIMRNDDSKVS